MKKILIPIFHGHIARNILRTDVLGELAKRAEVVLVVPDFKKDLYTKEFGSERVTVASSPQITFSRLDKFFRSFYYYFVDTETVKIIQAEQFKFEGKYLKYYKARLLTKIFGHSVILRKLVRHLDGILVKNNLFAPIFDQYYPDTVFIPSITSDDECLVLREAKKRGLKTVGMVRSWDNITVNKGNMRVAPDKMLVHTEILRGELVKYADYPKEKIEVVGMSHFDCYLTDTRMSRQAFFNQIRGDATKKTIYFMPIGLSDNKEDRYMLGLLEGWVKSDPAFAQTQLMLSAHPNATKPIDYALDDTLVIKFPGVIDYPGGKPTDREITRGDMELMASAIYHSDVVVNYQGTTSIDAAAFDRPVVNIAFDGETTRPYDKSVRRFYDYTHYQPILESGGVRLAHNQVELRQEILEYLKAPTRDASGRKKIIEVEVPGFDGKASQRTAEAILIS